MVGWVSLYGHSKFCFGSEIKGFKEYLKKQNKEEFGDFSFRKKCLFSGALSYLVICLCYHAYCM